MMRLSFFVDNSTRKILGINRDNVDQFTLCAWSFGEDYMDLNEILETSDKNNKNKFLVSGLMAFDPDKKKQNQDPLEYVIYSKDSLEIPFDINPQKTTNKPRGSGSFLSIFLSRDWENISLSESKSISKNQKSVGYVIGDIRESNSKLVSVNFPMDYISTIFKSIRTDNSNSIFGIRIPLCDYDTFQEEKDNPLKIENTDISNLGSIYVIAEYLSPTFTKRIYKQEDFKMFVFSTGCRMILGKILKIERDFGSNKNKYDYLKFLERIISNNSVKKSVQKSVSYWFSDFGDILYDNFYVLTTYSNDWDKIHKILDIYNIVFIFKNDRQEQEFDDRILWHLNCYHTEKWFNASFVLNRYLRGRLSEKSGDATLTLDYSYSNVEMANSTERNNCGDLIKKKGPNQKNFKLKFRPDVPGLCNFERFFWTYNNVKIPYPHISKIFVPKIDSVGFFGKKTTIHHKSGIDLVLTDKLAIIFEKSISTSCWKVGLTNTEFYEIINECFMLSDTRDEDFIISHEHVSKWISENSKSRYDLMQCMRCMTDFLSSVSCNLNYKSDRRMVRGDKDGKSFGLVYDIDSLDFEYFMGIGQEGDCDEAGITIDIVYSLMFQVPNFVKKVSNNGNFKCLKTMSFLVMNFVDFFTFSNVDTPKLESKNKNTKENEKSSTFNYDKKHSKNDFLNCSDDVFYNKADTKNDCQTGHSSTIIWPTIHVLKCYTDMIDLYNDKNFDWGRVFFGKTDCNKESVKTRITKHFQKKYFCGMFGEKIGMNMPNFSMMDKTKECEISMSSFITKLLLCIFPRIPIEGTGPQDALMMNMSSYYMDTKTEIDMIENNEIKFFDNIDSDITGNNYYVDGEIKLARILIDLQSGILESMKSIFSLESIITKKIEKICQKRNFDGHKDELYTHLISSFDDCDKRLSSKSFNITFHQTKKYSTDFFFENTNFCPRTIFFYRRSVLCTSELLRYIFNKKENVSNGNCLPMFESMYWMDFKKMTWGVPMKKIIETSYRVPNQITDTFYGNIVPLPSSLQRTIDYHIVTDSQNGKFIYTDPFLEQCLADRVVLDRNSNTHFEHVENDHKNGFFSDLNVINMLPIWLTEELSKKETILKKISDLNKKFIEPSSLLKKIGWAKKPLQNFFIQKKCFSSNKNIYDDKDVLIYVYKLKMIETIFNKNSEDIELLISFDTNTVFPNFKKSLIVRFQFFSK